MLAPLAAHIQSLKKAVADHRGHLGVAFASAFAYSTEMVAWLNRPFPNQLVFYGPTEALFASIKVSFLAGIILSLPIVFYQFWKFIEPALLPKEQRWAIPIFPARGAPVRARPHLCNLVILPLVIDFLSASVWIATSRPRSVSAPISISTSNSS